MAVSVTVLGSGSRGNCTVLSSSRTTLLIDAGFSCREIMNRMRAAGIDSEAIDALVISHEHSDHISAVDVLSRRMKLPVYMTEGTYRGWRRYMQRANGGPRPHLKKEDPCAAPAAGAEEVSPRPNGLRREIFQAGSKFEIGDIEITPFTIPHDAEDPVGFVFRVEGLKVGLVTDLGYVPRSIVEHLRGCHVLMIESNHDLEMLRVGPYPWAVKQRVMSRVGHLSNEALAQFIASDYDGAATYVILAHLSEQNNHPEIARRVAQRALAQQGNAFEHQDVPPATPERGCEPRLLLASQAAALESIRL